MSDHDSAAGSTEVTALAGDLADPAFWERPEHERRDVFARLRRLDRPVYVAPPGGRGYHALVRHADVVAVSKNDALFSSEPAVTTPEPPAWVRTVFGESMVNMDGKAHTGLRTVVSKAFTPRRVATIVDDNHVAAREIVDDEIARRTPDYVDAVA
ncbi:MAG: hypothetical protein ACT4RN_13095, partial [Pseudonocardia sp.]